MADSRTRNPNPNAGSLVRNVDDAGASLIVPPDSILTPDTTDAIRADLGQFAPVMPSGAVVTGATIQSGGVGSGNITVGNDLSLYDSYDGFIQRQNPLNNTTFVSQVGWTAGASCTLGTSSGTLTVTRNATTGIARVNGTGIGQVLPSGASIQGYAVTVGHTYTFTSYVTTAVTARSCNVGIDWYNAAGTLLSTSSGTATNDTTSMVVRLVSAVAPTGAAYCQPFVTWAGAVATEVHSIQLPRLWDRTAFEALGWSFANCTPYLVGVLTIPAQVTIASSSTSSGSVYNASSALYLVSTYSGVQSLATITGPKVPYDSTRTYEAAFQVLNISMAATNQTYINCNFYSNGTFVAQDSFFATYNLAYTNTTSFTNGSNLLEGGQGTPPPASAATITHVAGQYQWYVQATTDTIMAWPFQLVAGGQVFGHIKPDRGIDGLRVVGVSPPNTSYGGVGSAWYTIGNYPLDPMLWQQRAGRGCQVLLNWQSYFSGGTVANSLVSTRCSVSFDGGVTYLQGYTDYPASYGANLSGQGNNGYTYGAGAQVPLSGTAKFIGYPASTIYVKFEVYQSTGGVAGTFSQNQITALFVPT